MVALLSTSTDRASIAALLSRLTDQEIPPEQASKLLVFVGALSTILLGVTVADRQISDDEKIRLQAIVNEFVPTSSPLRSLFEVMFKGVKQHKLFNQPAELAQLTGDLSDSEMLLLLALGYELAAADGAIDPAEEDYLVQLAEGAGLDLALTGAIRDGLTEAATIDGDALAEVRHLLDPARFQDLDPVFSRAAERVLAHFPALDRAIGQPSTSIRYDGLAKFQAQRQHLQGVCAELGNLLVESGDRLSLPSSLTTDLAKIQTRLDSQTFRVAIVGEFSQGKSTLLNALLGEEIQPVRAIPCSGTVTVLRHGAMRRVIARYRDGREEEIPFEQYQEKAAISEDAALSNRDDALNSDLLELVLEHPGLALCQQGVELVDSPGLNEHPDRTRLTHQLLENVDAVIFLANASRPLTQGERELLQELRLRLNGGDASRPAENLFVVVNFMDLLRREKDQQQVKQLFENFLLGEAAVLSGSDRLHFISAQSALDALIDGNRTDFYGQKLNLFIKSLESFLTTERSQLITSYTRRQISLIQERIILSFQSYVSSLNSTIDLSEMEISSLTFEAKNIAIRLAKLEKSLAERLARSVNLISKRWDEEISTIKSNLSEDSQNWPSEGNSEETAKSFSESFSRKMSSEVNRVVGELKENIIIPDLDNAWKFYQEERDYVQVKLAKADVILGTKISEQYKISIKSWENELKIDISESLEEDKKDTILGWKAIGMVAGAGIAVTTVGVTLLPALIWGGLLGGWWGKRSTLTNDDIRCQALKTGLDQFDSTQAVIVQDLIDNSALGFSTIHDEAFYLFTSASESLDQLLANYQNRIRQSEEERNEARVYLNSKILHLESIMRDLSQIY